MDEHQAGMSRQVTKSNHFLQAGVACAALLLTLALAAVYLPLNGAYARGDFNPQASVRTPGDSAMVRIMTWNIRYDNPDDGVHAWQNRKEELLSFVVSQELDVFCIQEGLAGQVEFLKNGLHGFDVRGVGRDDGKEKGEYSAIYFKRMRFACHADGTFWLSTTPRMPGKGWDAALPRIVTWVRLYDSLTTSHLYVFNTHYDHQGVRARENSSHLVRRMIAEIAGESPFVLAGDFNSVETDSAYRILTAREGSPPPLFDALHRSATPHSGPSSTFTGFEMKEPDPGERIDYLFVSDSVRVKSHCTCMARRAAGYLSDHLPVRADIRLR